jgi:hypothetical protein
VSVGENEGKKITTSCREIRVLKKKLHRTSQSVNDPRNGFEERDPGS